MKELSAADGTMYEEAVLLMKKAQEVRENAYTPYSHFAVGAALLSCDGVVYTGCNVENASYGATNCAERTAFFKAVSEGFTEFEAIAIVGGEDSGEISNNFPDYAFPCGVCRQIMKEFCDNDFEIIVAKSLHDYKKFLLADLLPYGFGGVS